MITPIDCCRLCGNRSLELLQDLGAQDLTGVFPKDRFQPVTRGPMQLLKCHGEHGCGLVQLAHTYDLGEMYGHNYGYRSGLNPSMIRHLHTKVDRIRARQPLKAGDLVVDIGSNDSTTLQAYPQNLDLVGIDPTGVKFHSYYPKHIRLIPDFFTGERFAREFPDRKAKVITSFSMFYDLPDPLTFMRDVASALADDGIWIFEQSYMPTMLRVNSFDTVCHEHLEYYALKPVMWAAERAGLEIIDIEFNDVNGGSFSLVAAKQGSPHRANQRTLTAALADEDRWCLGDLAPYQAYASRSAGARQALIDFLHHCQARGERVFGLGASTKGNVLLQYCGITSRELQAIGEVNPEKFGCLTPGTYIPIIPESEALAQNPDYLLVLPWHFRDFFVHNPRFKGRRLVFPLPQLEILKPD